MIAIGGGIALIGNSAKLEGLAQDLTIKSDGVVLELEIFLMIAFLGNALLKFIWAHRLFGYCTIMMAAVPNEATDPEAYRRAAQAAEINITSAKSFNRGLRAIYFALASLAWLLSPWALLATTLLASGVLMRREFASTSRLVIMGKEAK